MKTFTPQTITLQTILKTTFTRCAGFLAITALLTVLSIQAGYCDPSSPAAHASLHDIHITHHVDNSSPTLFLASANAFVHYVLSLAHLSHL